MSRLPDTDSTDDPDAPVCPSQAAWDALDASERAAWRARLGPMPLEAQPPIGDPHIDAERLVEDAVGSWFKRRGRRAYIGRGITVYYPEAARFAPDFFVVLDAEPGPRTSWVVAHEGRGLDFVLEIHYAGDRHKDMVANVVRYARLGITEYFVYDVRNATLRGWRLENEPDRYVPVMPQRGRWHAPHLGVELGLVDGRLRFWVEGNLLPLRDEIADTLAAALDAAILRAEAEIATARAEAERAQAEAERAAAEIAAARAEAERAAAELADVRAEALRAKAEAERAAALEREVAALRARLEKTSPG